MALTLETSADMELLLHKQAAMKGQNDVTAYLLQLVEEDIGADLSEYAGLEDFAGSVAGIQAGLDDFDAGRTHSLEEVSSELEARAQGRRTACEGKRTA